MTDFTIAPPRRTKVDLMLEMMAEASGNPAGFFDPYRAELSAQLGPGRADQEMTEAEYQATRAKLMGELPGILRWMVEMASQGHRSWIERN